MSDDYVAVIQRLRRGWEWPMSERADGHRYWARLHPPGWEPLTPGERQVVEEAEHSDRKDQADG